MITYFQNRNLHLDERHFDNRRVIFDSLILGVASPHTIKRWTQRRLPNGMRVGEVLHSKTVDYKTFKPIRDGLFCERIFGPVKDKTCACGKEQPSEDVTFCPECEVEYGPATLRRRRLGYINLFSSVTHIWYLMGRPSYYSVALGRKKKTLQSLVYSLTVLIDVQGASILPAPVTNFIDGVYTPTQTVPFRGVCACEPLDKVKFLHYFTSYPQPGDQPIDPYTSKESSAGHYSSNDIFSGIDPDSLFADLLQTQSSHRDATIRSILAATGGDAIANLLERVDLLKVRWILAYEIRTIDSRIQAIARSKLPLRKMRTLVGRNQRLRAKCLARIKLLSAFIRTRKKLAWLVVSVLPVLPPDLRPLMLVNQQVMASDVNRLYQRVLFRNSRMKRLLILDMENIGYTKRLVQEAVDALIENGKGGSTVALDANDMPLKSLSDRLKGKRGRFRLNLLGKRVDYSGRSVIVVGPKLEVHACGLPREMALELFYPFLMRRLLDDCYADNIVQAKRYITRHHPIIWPVLIDIMRELPILLNRAPTLHRLGIQAFQPYLVAGQAITLHPLVCSGFNADFDGDQMAVHVPLSFHARAEAWRLIWSRNNLLAPATGQPILMPSQDMVLGCYYLTTDGVAKFKSKSRGGALSTGTGLYFSSPSDAIVAFHQEHIILSSQIWVNLPLETRCETGDTARTPKEIQLSANGNGLIVESKYQDRGLYVLSTDEAFYRAYLHAHRHYIRTMVGRILFNGALSMLTPSMTESAQKRLDHDVEAIVYGPKPLWDVDALFQAVLATPQDA